MSNYKVRQSDVVLGDVPDTWEIYKEDEDGTEDVVVVSQTQSLAEKISSLLDPGSTTLHVLMYFERPQNGDALVAINGPTIHTSHEDAILKLWEYVEGRIMSACKEEFIESCRDLIDTENNVEIGLSSSGLPIDEVFNGLDDEHFSKALSALSISNKENIIAFYFDLMNDECNEAVYQISTKMI